MSDEQQQQAPTKGQAVLVPLSLGPGTVAGNIARRYLDDLAPNKPVECSTTPGYWLCRKDHRVSLNYGRHDGFEAGSGPERFEWHDTGDRGIRVGVEIPLPKPQGV